jgi:hypothetical protein
MAPISVAVHGCIAKETELALAQRQQEFTMRTNQLDRAIDRERSPEDRQVVLRFLSAVGSDERMSRWAQSELARVDLQVKQLEEFRLDRDRLLGVITEGNAELAKAREETRKAKEEVVLSKHELEGRQEQDARLAKTDARVQAAKQELAQRDEEIQRRENPKTNQKRIVKYWDRMSDEERNTWERMVIDSLRQGNLEVLDMVRGHKFAARVLCRKTLATVISGGVSARDADKACGDYEPVKHEIVAGWGVVVGPSGGSAGKVDCNCLN